MPSGTEKIPNELTGRFDFRRSLSGKLILRVEEVTTSTWPWSRGERQRRWRDANAMDLAAAEMRVLIDMRSRPQFMAQRFAEPGEQPVDRTAPARDIHLDTPPADGAARTVRDGARRAWDAVKTPQ